MFCRFRFGILEPRDKVNKMGNIYTRLQSESSDNGAPNADARVGKSSTRNDAIVVYGEVTMGDFKKWYNGARYFNAESLERRSVNLDVGMTDKRI